MREISLEDTPVDLPFETYLAFGDTRTGKTTFAGTFPRPLFFSDATEQGWESLKGMDEQLFEPGIKPIVWGIEAMNDMAICIEKAKPLIASKRILTIVVDSISFYTDLYLNHLFAMQTKPDTRAAYGSLGTHLRDLRVRLHGLGVNVVWLALAKHPEQDDPRGRPLIPGQQADKFCAGTNFVFYTRTEQRKEGGKVVSKTYEIRTSEFGSYIAGNRLGGRSIELPDPFVGTYAELLTARGYDVDAVRKKLPLVANTPRIAQGTAPQPQVAKPAPAVIIRPAPKVVTLPPTGNGNPAQKGAIKQ